MTRWEQMKRRKMLRRCLPGKPASSEAYREFGNPWPVIESEEDEFLEIAVDLVRKYGVGYGDGVYLKTSTLKGIMCWVKSEADTAEDVAPCTDLWYKIFDLANALAKGRSLESMPDWMLQGAVVVRAAQEGEDE